MVITDSSLVLRYKHGTITECRGEAAEVDAESGKKTAAELAKDLTPRERLFVREYIADLNGTQAAVRAGYAGKSAASQASRLLRKEAVRAYRDALLQEKFDEIGITRPSLCAEAWEVYRRCMQKKAVLEWDSEKRAWIESGEWQFDAKGALRALDMLLRMLPKDEEEDGEDSFERLLAGEL